MKSITYLVVALFLISSFTVVGIGNEAGDIKQTFSNNFLEPTVNEGELIELEIEGTNSYIFSSGKPKLPIYRETITLPFGVNIKNIDCKVEDIKTEVLSKKITPSPQIIPKSQLKISNEPVFDEEIYSSEEYFPNDWFSYEIGVGIDENHEHKTFLTLVSHPVRYNAGLDVITYTDKIDITIEYEDQEIDPFPSLNEYDMVIITPLRFKRELNKLVDHKNNLNPPVNTTIKTTQEIYRQYNGYDKPEKIKNFIKDALETWGVKHVLLVGGLKSLIYADPRDNKNEGTKHWFLPARYTNLHVGGDEPGFVADLYYSDIYKSGGVFEDWDKNGNKVFGELGDRPDLYPDVNLGRLACRNIFEVRNMIDKIKNYESGPCGPSWFNTMLLVGGDGFLDQDDLDIQWDTNGLSNGQYTIYAQSSNPYGETGVLEVINVTLDKSQQSSINFNHDDYLRFPNYPDFPAKPMAEIVSVSEGDILGYDNVFYKPTEREAYCNSFTGWANVKYTNEVLYIRGKTYDPQPYGNVSTISVWVNNSQGTTVFSDNRTTEMYYEGEWTTGDIPLLGRAGGAYYVPGTFSKTYIWGSNGNIEKEEDLAVEFDKGSGLAFFSGHGSPNIWSNHYPGLPGNRGHGGFDGMRNVDLVNPPPLFPMQKLKNNYKNPVVVVGGCHNSMINVSFITTLLDKKNKAKMFCYGIPTAETWSWWLTRLSKRGAIGSIGNTGYGYGILGKECTIGGVDNWITTEFFVQYGTHGQEILGDAHSLTIKGYIDEFGKMDAVDAKTVEQWILLGDPSLKIGGYGTSQQKVAIEFEDLGYNADGVPNNPVSMHANTQGLAKSYEWSFDTTGDGEYDTYETGESLTYSWDKPGVYWIKVKAIYDDHEEITETIVDIESNGFPEQPNKPSGYQHVRAGIPYVYKTSAKDPEENDLWYLYDWGDGTYSVAGPKQSGEKVKSIHKYKQKGTYEIKVMAINEFSYWSEWSEPLTVNVLKSKSQDTTNQPIILLLQKILSNHPNLFPILRQGLGL
jgi:hypothetical protein